jgi:hypothetical protein
LRRTAARPAIRCRLDLFAGDRVTRPLGQAQGVGGGKGAAGNLQQRLVSHLLFGTVNEVTPTLLGQWAVPLPGKGARIREQLVEHS